MSNAPSYTDNDPKGWCGNPKRGAAMGRGSYHAEDQSAPVKLYLRRIRLNGDYDSNGTYFGSGDPLYWVADSSGQVDYMLRACGREQAKSIVREDYPNASFFR
jgi:hypothetical protein